jgi:quercetin dioxygenase-like cupin family protein
MTMIGAGSAFARPAASLPLLGLAAAAALALIPLVHRHAGDGATSMAMPGMEMANSQAGGRPTTKVRPISCEKLPDIPGKSMTTVIVDFPPNAYTPRHRHRGSVKAFMLKGTLRSQLAGGPVGTYTVGQGWFEPPGAIHLFAENASATEPAELLAIFVADDDCGPLTIPD